MIPVIVVSHRRDQFIDRCIASLKEHLHGAGSITIVDDSGSARHRRMVATRSGCRVVPVSAEATENVGYLAAMDTVWRLAAGSPAPVLTFEEDFTLDVDVDVWDLAMLLDDHPELAQINLQRQAVYGIELEQGYLASHEARGYELTDHGTWIERARPFTTNPGLIRPEIFDIDWPARDEWDPNVDQYYEPQMGKRLEDQGWRFAWWGGWDQPATTHHGTEMKTGKAY